MIIAKHVSPDGLLELIVARDAEGDYTVGFSPFPWHTHGDILAAVNGGTPEVAVARLIEDVLASCAVLVLSRIDGELCDVWVADDPDDDEASHAAPNETIEKRYWNGCRYE
ncbi:MAG: hypothetical protein KDB29_15210 [Planctomycetes bacterium]|nr:hypothetical protein [Planctomycetota bacterium]